MAALDRFVAETQGEVWSLCRYLGDARDADDLAQEVYERAIKSIARFRADGSGRDEFSRTHDGPRDDQTGSQLPEDAPNRGWRVLGHCRFLRVTHVSDAEPWV